MRPKIDENLVSGLYSGQEGSRDSNLRSRGCPGGGLKPKLMKKHQIEITDDLFTQLKEINLTLWNIEDQIRIKEKNKEFDNIFIELARSVYFKNDKRAEIKKRINQLSNSEITEEKSYAEY